MILAGRRLVSLFLALRRCRSFLGGSIIRIGIDTIIVGGKRANSKYSAGYNNLNHKEVSSVEKP